MDSRGNSSAAAIGLSHTPIVARAGRRIVWHALGLLFAAAVTWLIFAAYRQPDLILDLAAFRLC